MNTRSYVSNHREASAMHGPVPSLFKATMLPAKTPDPNQKHHAHAAHKSPGPVRLDRDGYNGNFAQYAPVRWGINE